MTTSMPYQKRRLSECQRTTAAIPTQKMTRTLRPVALALAWHTASATLRITTSPSTRTLASGSLITAGLKRTTCCTPSCASTICSSAALASPITLSARANSGLLIGAQARWCVCCHLPMARWTTLARGKSSTQKTCVFKHACCGENGSWRVSSNRTAGRFEAYPYPIHPAQFDSPIVKQGGTYISWRYATGAYSRHDLMTVHQPRQSAAQKTGDEYPDGPDWRFSFSLVKSRTVYSDIVHTNIRRPRPQIYISNIFHPLSVNLLSTVLL